jgi:L-ascorbate metabolism protein UlaG (beta-lactamase superfamily)
MSGQTINITWIGHATVLIEVNGFRVLTDPALTSRLAHLRRRVAVIDVGPIDAVLISHAHMDHLHTPSLRLVSRDATIVVPAGAESVARRVGAEQITGVVSGDCIALARQQNVTAKVVHAEHAATRGPHSSVHAAPVGYIVEIGERRIYFAGDTGLFDGMRDLGPLDVALLPIWGWGAALGRGGHMDPADAAEATSWMQPGVVMPIHWGTYSPARIRRGNPQWFSNPIKAFRHELSQRDMADQLMTVEPGGSIQLNDSAELHRHNAP